MRFSYLFTKTTKDTVDSLDSANARFLVQGGFISQVMAGVYNYLPLGLRVIDKISHIIRQEMNAIDGQEISMSKLVPIESLEKTCRDNVDVAYKPTPGTALGFSHEEIATPLMKHFISSYKDLPVSIYQIQTKFRNEARAKAGILRGREFLMKDMYSFHADQTDLDAYYERAKTAYMNVYNRCGVKAYAIEASGGIFSKEPSHEYVVETEVGEDTMLYCKESGVMQNMEIAKATLVHCNPDEAPLAMETHDGNHGTTIAVQSEFYGIEPWKILKHVVYVSEQGEFIVVVIRGDLDVSEEKLTQHLGFLVMHASDEQIAARGLVKGFISVINNESAFDRIIADVSVDTVHNYVTGNNVLHDDLINVNVGTDVVFEEYADLYTAQEGMICYTGKGKMKASRIIEVGNIFKLGSKYSDAFDLKYMNSEGKRQSLVMGCYGIGVSRLMGTIVETSHDDRGIIWPISVAPYQIHLVSIGKDKNTLESAEKLYRELQSNGAEVLYDDRNISPGKKLGDADLIGIPLRIVVSARSLENNQVEWKERKNQEMMMVDVDQLSDRISDWLF